MTDRAAPAARTDGENEAPIEVRAAPRPHWIAPGFLIRRYIAREPDLVRRLDPFLQLDYHAPFAYPPTPYRRGLPAHPHRGYATVTLVFDGRLAYDDHSGANGTIGPGDVHWVHAGRGVMHEEFHEPTFARTGGTLHMLQLWINLPAACKMGQPRDRVFRTRDVPTSLLPGGAGAVRTIAGTFGDACGPARPVTALRLLDVTLVAGGRFACAPGARGATAALVIDGRVRIGDRCDVGSSALAIVTAASDGSGDAACEIRSERGARVIVFDGDPIGEPLVRDGPFAMNTLDEVRAARGDLRAGRFAG